MTEKIRNYLEKAIDLQLKPIPEKVEGRVKTRSGATAIATIRALPLFVPKKSQMNLETVSEYAHDWTEDALMV